MLAVVLQRAIAAHPGSGATALADAFDTTFWVAFMLVAAGLVPALMLPRRARRGEEVEAAPQPT